MMFIVALNFPWCWYLGAQEGVEPQLYADKLKCVSRDLLGLLLGMSGCLVKSWLPASVCL